MSEENRQAMIEFLGIDDYKEFWKTVKHDLYSRVSLDD